MSKEWVLVSAEHIHHFVEAKKIAYADRAKYYADPDFQQEFQPNT